MQGTLIGKLMERAVRAKAMCNEAADNIDYPAADYWEGQRRAFLESIDEILRSN